MTDWCPSKETQDAGLGRHLVSGELTETFPTLEHGGRAHSSTMEQPGGGWHEAGSSLGQMNVAAGTRSAATDVRCALRCRSLSVQEGGEDRAAWGRGTMV